MTQNTVAVAILVGALIMGIAIYLKPTEFDSCVNGHTAGGYDRHVSLRWCARE